MARTEKLESVNVSSINDFLDDKLRWCYKWVENRVPRRVPRALTSGKIIHAAFETHFKDPSVSVASALVPLIPVEETLLDPEDQKEADMLRGLVEPLQFWKDDFKVTETLEVEQPFEAWLTSGAKFRGRPDRVVLAYGKVFHMQHKSIGASTKLGVFLTLAYRNLHELMYGRYLMKKYGDKQYIDPITNEVTTVKGFEYGGSIYNTIRKLKYRSKVTTKKEPLGKILHTPDEILHQGMIPFNQEQSDIANEEVNLLSVAMDRTLEAYLGGHRIPSNRRLDGGYHGNSIDPYTLVMLGEASLDDEALFMDREETYDLNPEEENAE